MDFPMARDVETVGRIAAVPTILEVVARTTGMRFTAVARVTDTHWMACAVYDQIEFGLKPGGELVLETTICNEIRQHHQPVIFGHASTIPTSRRTPRQSCMVSRAISRSRSSAATATSSARSARSIRNRP